VRLVRQKTPAGDDCHYNITQMTDAQCKDMLFAMNPMDCEICDPGGLRNITEQELVAAGKL
jgi:hypothetical protein